LRIQTCVVNVGSATLKESDKRIVNNHTNFAPLRESEGGSNDSPRFCNQLFCVCFNSREAAKNAKKSKANLTFFAPSRGLTKMIERNMTRIAFPQ
jgi:hypothetical protein